MMRQRGSELKTPPFFRKIALVKVCHLSVLALTYGLALLLFPTISQGLSTRPYFDETYLGCIAASIALSVVALACGSGMRLYVVFLLRCYLLVVLGYSIGGASRPSWFSASALWSRSASSSILPYNLVIAGVALVVLVLVQVFPVFFGRRPRRLDSPRRLRSALGVLLRPRRIRPGDRMDRAPGRAQEGARRDHPHPGSQPRHARRAQPQPPGLCQDRRRGVLGARAQPHQPRDPRHLGLYLHQPHRPDGRGGKHAPGRPGRPDRHAHHRAQDRPRRACARRALALRRLRRRAAGHGGRTARHLQNRVHLPQDHGPRGRAQPRQPAALPSAETSTSPSTAPSRRP